MCRYASNVSMANEKNVLSISDVENGILILSSTLNRACLCQDVTDIFMDKTFCTNLILFYINERYNIRFSINV